MENRSIIQSNFIIANRDLINKFGVNSAILLGELYGRYNYFKKRNQLKSKEWICFKENDVVCAVCRSERPLYFAPLTARTEYTFFNRKIKLCNI